MNRVSIIGFGRFGAMLHSLLSKGFEVDVYDKNSIDNSECARPQNIETNLFRIDFFTFI